LAAFAAQAADPIKVGMVAPLTGPGAESGVSRPRAQSSRRRGQQGGGVLGRPLELVTRMSDHQSGRRAGLQQARRNAEFAAFLGR